MAQYLFLALLLSSPCMQIPVNEFNDDVSEDQDYMGAVNCSRFVASTPKRKSSDFSFFFPITLEVPPSPIITRPISSSSKALPSHQIGSEQLNSVPGRPIKSRPSELSFDHSPMPKKTCIRRLMLEKRSTRRQAIFSKHPVTNPIVVEDYQPKHPPPQKWIPELNLYMSDKNILMNNESWVTDSIIDAAQTLIKDICPVSGLQKVCCGLTLSFSVQTSEFLQILNTGNGHWLLVSTIGTVHPTVYVYDSAYPTVSTFVEKQIACLLSSEEKEVDLQFINIQMQYGQSNCGMFAIAFATALALGHQPEGYHFIQDEMRVLICLNVFQIKRW